jgi:predicted nucleotidyltransferase component of viral defense system
VNNAIQQMLSRYECRSFRDYEQALREIFQEIVLVGLWRGKFFEHAAFYGGTALRIFYNLDRFSEDLDFTLVSPNIRWSWAQYSESVVNELRSFGLEAVFVEKKKKLPTAVQSAFLKASAVRELLHIGVRPDLLHGVSPESMIRVKIEIDTNPPQGFGYEEKFLSQPVPVAVRCVNEASLFASKIRAAFFRTWKRRVKGRDWYDVVWFIRRKVSLDLQLFSTLNGDPCPIDRDTFLKMANERIDQLDISAAIEDILPFVRDGESLRKTWSKDFFRYWLASIDTVTTKNYSTGNGYNR